MKPVLKIAVITPTYQTPRAWLEKCLASVAGQTVPCTHFLVCDGDEPPALLSGVEVIRLARPHQDAGNTARAIGSISAIGQGFDAIAYLDADNWYEPQHLKQLLAVKEQTGALICSCTRNLYDLEGNLLGLCPEVNGNGFVDTNCLLLTRPAFGLVASWYLLPPSLAPVGDRVFWRAVRDSRLKRAHLALPTVNYRTAYRVHYEHFHRPVPAGAKIIDIPPQRTGKVPLTFPSSQSLIFGPEENPARPKVSLGMIVKNEEENLAACLACVRGLFDEIIIIDTGSTDRTKEVAARFGALVVDFTWQDSFAAARNESLRHARGEWFFWLDADDRLDGANRARLQAILGNLPQENKAFFMRQWSPPEQATGSALIVDHARLFRRLPSVSWRYRIHEQILPALRAAGAELVWTDIVIEHLGYGEAGLRQQKLERNLRLLELELQENPTEPFTLFNLGGTLLDAGLADKALPHLRRCLECAPAGASFLPKTFVLLAQGCRFLGQEDEALKLCQQGLKRHPQDGELLFEEGLLLQARRDWPGARRSFEKILELRPQGNLVPQDAGLVGYQARHNLALVYRGLHLERQAEEQWLAALRQCPDFGQAWLGLVELYLDQGRQAEIHKLIEDLHQEPRGAIIVPVLRARQALFQGNLATAQTILQEAIGQAPQIIWFRLLLSEILLREGKDLVRAEQNLRQILALNPNQKTARQKLHKLWAGRSPQASS